MLCLTTNPSIVRRQTDSEEDGIFRTLPCKIYFLNTLPFLVNHTVRVFLLHLTEKGMIYFKSLLTEICV